MLLEEWLRGGKKGKVLKESGNDRYVYSSDISNQWRYTGDKRHKEAEGRISTIHENWPDIATALAAPYSLHYEAPTKEESSI